jgi:hypothetical protein
VTQRRTRRSDSEGSLRDSDIRHGVKVVERRQVVTDVRPSGIKEGRPRLPRRRRADLLLRLIASTGLLGRVIGGQLAAGFVLTGFYEDIDPDSILGGYIPSYIATWAIKPAR